MARVLAIWCMDWLAVAAACRRPAPTAAVAVTLANRVIACSASARSAGAAGLAVESQARCPQLHVVTADPARDARHFENVTAAVDDLVPRAEVLRPGLLVLPVRGAARYFGSSRPPLSGWSPVAAAGAECSGRYRRPAAHAVSPHGQAGSSPPDQTPFLSVVDPAAGPRAEPSAPGRDDLADLLWRMGTGTSVSSQRCPVPMWPPGSGPTRWPRTVRPRRANPRPVGP